MAFPSMYVWSWYNLSNFHRVATFAPCDMYIYQAFPIPSDPPVTKYKPYYYKTHEYFFNYKCKLKNRVVDNLLNSSRKNSE